MWGQGGGLGHYGFFLFGTKVDSPTEQENEEG